MNKQSQPTHAFNIRSSRFMGLSLVAIAMLLSTNASGQMTGTLTLDSLSFISFQDQQILSLPAGSTLEFQFGQPNANGTIPFSISPTGLSIAPIGLPSSAGSLLYGLAGTATGLVVPTTDGHIIRFSANVTASLQDSGTRSGTYTYPMLFTTETTAATDVLGQTTVERTGVRLIDGVWYIQLVAATTNNENAFPAPGMAVYSVLSGQFDQLPIGQ